MRDNEDLLTSEVVRLGNEPSLLPSAANATFLDLGGLSLRKTSCHSFKVFSFHRR